jgi:hypothetical protein
MNKRNRILTVSLLLLLAVAVVFTVSCKKKEEAAGPAADKLKVVLYVNGTLGDKSFFDSAARGLQMAIDQLGIEGKIVEGGYDRPNGNGYRPAGGRGLGHHHRRDLALQDYWSDRSTHPEKKFFTYDRPSSTKRAVSVTSTPSHSQTRHLSSWEPSPPW